MPRIGRCGAGTRVQYGFTSVKQLHVEDWNSKQNPLLLCYTHNNYFASFTIHVQGNDTKSREFLKLCAGNKFLRFACMKLDSPVNLH